LYSTGSGTTTTAIELFAFDPPLLLLAISLFFRKGKASASSFRSTDVAALLFVCLCCLSLVNSVYPKLTFVRLPVLFRMPLIYYCFSRGIRNPGDIKVLSTTLVVCLIIQSGLAIMQTLFGSFSWLNAIVERTDQVTYVHVGKLELGRATGTIGYSTVLAQYLGLVAPLALSICLIYSGKRLRLISGFAWGLAAIAIILSMSRAAWLNLVIVFVLMSAILVFRKKRLRSASVGFKYLVIILVIGLITAVFFNAISGRLSSPDANSAYSRIPMAMVAWKIITANPIFGIGLHNYTQVMRRYGLSELLPGWDFGVHNSFLYMAAEIGVLGSLAVLYLWFSTLAKLFYCLRGFDNENSALCLGLICGLIALFIHSNVEEGFHVHQVLGCMLWSFFGLAAALKAMVVRYGRAVESR
jgi:O-antigen ligase